MKKSFGGIMIAVCAMAAAGGGCQHVAPITGTATGGGGERCIEAKLVAAPLTMTGDLTNARDDSNGRIAVTGYSWSGRDQFYALNLTAGQTLTFLLDDHGAFDGGLYIFRDCNNIPGTAVGGLDTNPQRPFVFAAPSTGRYILAVDAWIANTGGPYTLTITPGGTPVP